MKQMPPTVWRRLGMCWRGVCDFDQYDAKRYDEYKGDRATVVRVQTRTVEADYIIGEFLGKGDFGLVKEGIHRKDSSRAALKFVERKNLSDRDERLLLFEAGILTGLAHEHLVRIRNLYKWDEAYCLALEYMAGGELCQDMRRKVSYSEACARRIIFQVLDVLGFLHRRGIVHRDIKPENLLFPQPGGIDVKLADFGLATLLSPPTYKVAEPVGTPGYAAPEVFRRIPYDGQVDVFSLGVIAFILLAGYRPFRGSSIGEVVNATLSCNPTFNEVKWSATTQGARDFVKALLTLSPGERPTAEGALFHPWMTANARRNMPRSCSAGDRRSGRRDKALLEDIQAQ